MSNEKKKERIDKFEDLIAGQKARGLTREVYQTSGLGAFAKDFGLAGQIQKIISDNGRSKSFEF